MEASKRTDELMTSAAAFVEGGVQEACDDACSICLEDFSQSDPSTVTNCEHEFHLQCILEWCQRSSNCPLCWRPISLRDAMSQTLLEAVEEERTLTSDRLRNATMFHHPSLVDFDLEEQIFQHLAAAAAGGRGRHIFRREGQGNWSSSQGQTPFFVFSAHNAPTDNASISHGNSGDDQDPSVSTSRPQTHRASAYRVGSNVSPIDQQRISSGTRSFVSRSSQGSQETGEQSDLQSFSESVRSRLNTWSMRYKESISRNARGWKERLFSRSSSMADVGSDVQREVHAGLASVSRLMERLDVRENVGSGRATGSSNSGYRSDPNNLENHARLS